MELTEEITQNELLAVRFYMGDPEVVSGGRFRGGAKAYNTINALLHPGTDNEKDKAREGKVVAIEDGAHLKSYLQLIPDIYKAMEKYRRQHGTDYRKESRTYRIDREASFIRFEQNHHTVAGFFSTCKKGFLPEYAHTKADIVMLEVERGESVPFLDFEALFQKQYAKPEEAEVLLPFGMIIQKAEQLPVSAEEALIYRDMNGRAPVGKWRLHMEMGNLPEVGQELLERLYERITAEENVAVASQCMEKLSASQSLTPMEEQFYGTWKMQLQQYINGCVYQINH